MASTFDDAFTSTFEKLAEDWGTIAGVGVASGGLGYLGHRVGKELGEAQHQVAVDLIKKQVGHKPKVIGGLLGGAVGAPFMLLTAMLPPNPFVTTTTPLFTGASIGAALGGRRGNRIVAKRVAELPNYAIRKGRLGALLGALIGAPLVLTGHFLKDKDPNLPIKDVGLYTTGGLETSVLPILNATDLSEVL